MAKKNDNHMFAKRIKVIGVGGSGSNAVSRMAKHKISGIELIAVNTDAQDLRKVNADTKIQIGKELTQGLGSGMNPEIGKRSAEESMEEIKNAIEGADMVFITCGFGGGTGTGAAGVIADISKELGILTVVIVTKPFSFEGEFRRKIAEEGLKELKNKVDALIVISNDKLLSVLDPKISFVNAFIACDDILRQAVQSISDLIMLPGLINVDFADVKTIMQNSGSALFGVGWGKGERRAETAIRDALGSPLLDVHPKGAKGILFNVSGDKDISISEIEEIGEIIGQEIGAETKVIFGAVYDNSLKKGEIKVTVIATGF